MKINWTIEEDSILKLNSNLSVKNLQKLFPNRTISAIENRKSVLKLKNNIKRKYTLNFNFFENYNLISAYWAGFIAADGTIRNKNRLKQISLFLGEKDKNHVIQFAKDLGYNGPIVLRKKTLPHNLEKIFTSFGVQLCGATKLIDNLWTNYNIGPKKSLTLKPPIQIVNNDIKFAFLIGYIDGDGTISLDKKNRISLDIIGTKELVTWAKDICDYISPCADLKYNPKVRKEKKNSKIFIYGISGLRALKILNVLNKVNVPKLQRKWNKLENAITKNNKIKIDQEKLKEIVFLKNKGYSFAKIASELNFSTSGIYSAYKNSGF